VFSLSPSPAEKVRSVNVTPELEEFGNTRLDLAPAKAARGLRLNRSKRPSVPLLHDKRPISAQKAPTVSTALIPVAARDAAASLRHLRGRPRADFLAQLIATAAQAPQTRLRRRAEPEEAVAAYGARDRSPMQRPVLSRCL
jgi:hypothetical protein